MQLATLLNHPQTLPTVPRVVHLLIDSLNREDVSTDSIGHTICADPVLSGKLLRLANSPYYRMSRHIGSVDEAVIMLGLGTVRSLVIGAGVAGAFASLPGLDLRRFWHYSIQAAATAQWIAREVHIHSDHAFTVGLMHALGYLVMHAGMPELMAYMDKACDLLDARRPETERATLGYTHAVVTGSTMSAWKFPPVMVDAVGEYLDPLAHGDFDPLAGVLHLAAWRARAQQYGLTRDDLHETVPALVCAKLEFPADELVDEMPCLDELSEGLFYLVS